MTFTVVHTADWQLGKPFGRFDPEKAAVLRHARLTAIDRIADVARRSGAAHVLVAGDVFDAEAAPDHLIRQALSRMASHADIDWHLLPGNHDPARTGGLWHIIAGLGVPERIHLHLKPQAAEIAPGVHLLPAPLTAKATTTDPTAWMQAAPTPPGTLRIGLAHGSVQGFGSPGEAAVPIHPARAKQAGLDYLALGDWHGLKQISPETWYSGTPEPDSFTGNDPGHTLVVRFGADRRIDIEPVRTASYHWHAMTIETVASTMVERVARECANLPAALGSCLLSLTVKGRVPPAVAAELEAGLLHLEGQLFDLRVDRRELVVVAGAEDIASLGQGAVRKVAERLQRLAKSPDPQQARIASLALATLFSMQPGSAVLEDA